ncbi:hypothetical protein [Deinococcus sp. QL22]|uniref:hypothetical protein n=1 Tax=Deinococcus sp. QL22 TaxID=2939437 RepID=UPI002016C8A7|nr:hypothetical protein [Deinococcus sp. QL22]UQN06546.1 hypothetical protein M1R55_01090 [Deinococcus sp. QL22]
MAVEVFQRFSQMNLGNVLLLHGLVACALYDRKLKDPEVAHLVEMVRRDGRLGSPETLYLTRRLIKRAFRGKLKGADDAYSRLLSLALSSYEGTLYADDEVDLPVMWCTAWLAQIAAVMVRDVQEINACMLDLVTQFEADFLAVAPLPCSVQQAVLLRCVRPPQQ